MHEYPEYFCQMYYGRFNLLWSVEVAAGNVGSFWRRLGLLRFLVRSPTAAHHFVAKSSDELSCKAMQSTDKAGCSGRIFLIRLCQLASKYCVVHQVGKILSVGGHPEVECSFGQLF